MNRNKAYINARSFFFQRMMIGGQFHRRDAWRFAKRNAATFIFNISTEDLLTIVI